MTSKSAVVLCLVLACLQLGVNARRDDSLLAREPQEAQRTLDSLPSHCSSGVTELILAEEARVSELLGNCSKRAIFFHISELLTDTSYFGFSLYNHVSTLFSDLRLCFEEKCMIEKVFCVLEKAPGAAETAVELALGVYSYVQQVKTFLPEIKSEIQECRNSTVTEYRQFLDTVVSKSGMC